MRRRTGGGPGAARACTNSDAYPDSDAYTRSDSDSDANTNSDAYADAHTDPYTHTNANPNSDAHTDANANSDSDSGSHPDAALSRPRRYQFQPIGEYRHAGARLGLLAPARQRGDQRF
jgi:hypothetical protein